MKRQTSLHDRRDVHNHRRTAMELQLRSLHSFLLGKPKHLSLDTTGMSTTLSKNCTCRKNNGHRNNLVQELHCLDRDPCRWTKRACQRLCPKLQSRPRRCMGTGTSTPSMNCTKKTSTTMSGTATAELPQFSARRKQHARRRACQ